MIENNGTTFRLQILNWWHWSIWRIRYKLYNFSVRHFMNFQDGQLTYHVSWWLWVHNDGLADVSCVMLTMSACWRTDWHLTHVSGDWVNNGLADLSCGMSAWRTGWPVMWYECMTDWLTFHVTWMHDGLADLSCDMNAWRIGWPVMGDGDEKLGLELRLVKAGESLPGRRRLKMCRGQAPK